MGKAVTKGPKLPADFAAQVDELGALEERFARLEKDQKRAKELRGAVAEWFKDCPPKCDGVVSGRLFAVSVTARKEVRSIPDLAAVFAALGKRAFLEECSFPPKKLETLLPKALDEGLLVIEPTGNREVTVTRRLERKKAA